MGVIMMSSIVSLFCNTRMEYFDPGLSKHTGFEDDGAKQAGRGMLTLSACVVSPFFS